MRAISLYQPWASAMALDKKRVETRGWPTSYRGDLVICSAKRRPSPLECGDAETFKAALEMPYGCAVCVVELYDCLPTERVVFHLGMVLFEREKEWGDYTPGRFGWCTRNLRKLNQPVPMIGKQGLFILPEQVVALIKEQLP